jgi:nicotinamide-nucleotide amidase
MPSLKTAACVAIGSELLGDDRLDSNSLRITATLARFGIEVVEKRVVGDSVDRLAAVIAELMTQVDLVMLTGGLGPTADDVTREAVARALGRDLVRDPELEEWILSRYQAHGRVMPDVCRKMADVVQGARPLANTRGAAPGILINVDGRILVALPGVPWEMEDMLERDVVAELEVSNPGIRRLSRSLLLGGVFESAIEERIAPLYQRFGGNRVTILAKCGVVRLVLTAQGDANAAARRLDEMESEFRQVLGDDLAGVDVSGIEDVVLQRLRDRKETLATAESCTGGMLGARITGVAGASDVFVGGVVSYSNDVKTRVVGVPESLLVAHGAVSEPVARAMAEGVRERLGADWGVGVTGIAGPGGGTEDKPVGLVYWAVASSAESIVRRQVFPGTREVVRLWSVHSVLDLLRRGTL